MLQLFLSQTEIFLLQEKGRNIWHCQVGHVQSSQTPLPKA
jgi:hypothetical protein